jgi:spore maturation protein A
MLNYIWAGLIVFSVVFALNTDIRDIANDTYRNAKLLPVTIRFKPDASGAAARQSDVEVLIDHQAYQRHYGTSATPAPSYSAKLTRADGLVQIRFPADTKLPEPLATIRDATSEQKELLAEVRDLSPGSDGVSAAGLGFEPVRFVKLRGITLAAFEFAKTAVTLAFGLVGTLALWLGLMKIAEASGLVAILIRVMNPLLRPLFPQVPRDHPALGMIAINLAANMLGLANAATAPGLKAMEQLQKLNPTDDTATDPMVMLMAVNTAGVQLVPSALLVAVVGITVTELFVPIILVTGGALVVAIVCCKLFERLPAYRRTNPNVASNRRQDGPKEEAR